MAGHLLFIDFCAHCSIILFETSEIPPNPAHTFFLNPLRNEEKGYFFFFSLRNLLPDVRNISALASHSFIHTFFSLNIYLFSNGSAKATVSRASFSLLKMKISGEGGGERKRYKHRYKAKKEIRNAVHILFVCLFCCCYFFNSFPVSYEKGEM